MAGERVPQMVWGGTLYASMLNDLLKIQGASAGTTKSSISIQP